ncbi:MAG TPA: glucosyl-3-phosphoglycerate synthase [Chloroflexota bacterium]|nr:glucosyl-3-phosphoglycerate synthase [Chloroflexota bacterium]
MSTGVDVLIPFSGMLSSREMLGIAGAVTARYGGATTVLGVVEVPEERSLSEAALLARRHRTLLRRAALYGDADVRAQVVPTHSLAAGIRTGVEETGADLLLLGWRPGRKPASDVLAQFAADPPCDLAAVKPGKSERIERVLVPARGGPHARLALRLAAAVAARHNATLTLLHVSKPEWSAARRSAEALHFQRVCESIEYPHVRRLEIDSPDVESVLRTEGARHDMVVMGAAARDERSVYLFGLLPERVARAIDAAVVVVKTREPVTAGMFGRADRSVAAPEHASISELVDRWFARNTFHSHEFRSLRYLVDLKERQGRTISVALPALNEEKTVGKIISTIKRTLMERVPLVDELLLIDSNSDDRTVEIAEGLGIPVYRHPEILPHLPSYAGKGEALWKSLYVTKGDIVVWVDSDITDLHPKFVYGLVGPLLADPALGFIKGFYRRPLKLGGELATTGGGRVTELTARPLINLFYPQLSGVVQPLAGEMAGRRDILETLPFFTGYGVETGLLIDILERYGLDVFAQADLEYRIHRNQTLLSLSKMAFAIVQVVMQRLGERDRLRLADEMNSTMKLIHYSPTELFLEVKEIHENERPPIVTLPEYRMRHHPESATLPALAEA